MSEPSVIYETVHGSNAYGLARAGSDVDVKGVMIGPAAWYFGWAGGPEQIDLSPDHVRYEIRKFFRLAVDANPTVLELMWTRPEDHRVVSAAGERLLAVRDSFLSRRVAERFGRYALAQLKRIRTHRTWLVSPPDESAQTQWRHYNDWLKNRNPARSDLEARFGYDTKHGMHLVRLQRMALEILTTGTVHVFRPDRDELLAIRDGAWTFDELEVRASDMSAKIDAAAQRPGPQGHSPRADPRVARAPA